MSRITVHRTKNQESTSSPSEPSPEGTASASRMSAVDANEVKSFLASITAIAGPPLELTAKDRQRSVRIRKGVGVPIQRVNTLIAGKRGVTAETAILLSRVFETSAELWMNLQTACDLYDARRRLAVVG